MPENNNQNDREINYNDLPLLNNNAENELPKFNNQVSDSIVPEEHQEQKPLIEIPKEYYEKIEAEKHEKEEQEHKKQEMQMISNQAGVEGGNIFFISILNAIVIFVLLYLMLNKNEMFILAIPVYIIIASIIFGAKRKKESNYPAGTIMGGMLVAICTFIISMVIKENIELWTHYAMCSAVVGFVGYLISNTITKIIFDFKNIKALKTIGYIIFFIAIIGVPYYLYQKYPNEFYRIVFQKQTEVVASTQSEFIEKTLKNRYGLDIKCDDSTIKNQIDQQLRKITVRACKTPDGISFTVTSKAYNEGGVQYIVEDTLFDELYLNEIKESVKEDLKITLGAEEINFSLFPKEDCSFIGDCVACDEYYKAYEKENNIDKQYEASTKINLEKYLNLNPKQFVNTYNFRYVIDVIGVYNQVDQTFVENLVTSTLNRLNALGYKNTYGFEIEIQDSYGLKKKIYRVTGETNKDKTFKDPIVDTDL